MGGGRAGAGAAVVAVVGGGGRVFPGGAAAAADAGLGGFRRWSKHGRELAELSSALAASYFRASPATLAFDHVCPARRLGQPREAAVQGHVALGVARRAVLRRESGVLRANVAGGGAGARAVRGRAVRPVVRPRVALPERRAARARAAERRRPWRVLAVRRGLGFDRVGGRAVVSRKGPHAAGACALAAAGAVPEPGARAGAAGGTAGVLVLRRGGAGASRRSTRSRTGCSSRFRKSWSSALRSRRWNS